MGDWMVPLQDKIFETIVKFEQDPRNVSIDDAYGLAHNFIDILFKNRDTCQVGKVYDDYKTWCVSNLDQCVGSDNGFLERIYTHGPDLFSAFYDLAGVFLFNLNDCKTDAEYINDHKRVVADVSSIGSAIIGFEADYSVKNKHISEKDFQSQIQEYFNDMYTNMTMNYDNLYASPETPYAQDLDLFGGFDFKLPDLFGQQEHQEKPEFLDIFEMPEMDMPDFNMPQFEMPEMPDMQMPEMDVPLFDFQKFKLW